MVDNNKKNKLKNIFLLFITFFKIGLFTFGGGYAMISLIQTEVSEKMKWLDKDEMVKLIVISQSAPGILAVNSATFVGYKVAGIAGAALSVFGITLPSLIIICIISLFFNKFKSLKYVEYAFNGIRAGVILVIINAVRKLDKANKKDLFYFIILGITVIVSLWLKISAPYILIAAMILGILYAFIFVKNKTDKDNNGGENKN